MEQVSLEVVNKNLMNLMKVVEEMKEILVEDELELSDEVLKEIEEGRNADESEFVSHEDFEVKFLK